MISVLAALMPVLLVVLLGMLFRKRGVLSESTVSELKVLLVNNILPIAIFNALATTKYNEQTLLIVTIMFGVLLLSFGIGFLMRPLIRQPFQKYVPFVVTLYEGGMIAYPLYTQLCGSENISRIAILDIAVILFAFGFYMNSLALVERGEKPNLKKIVTGALKMPVFDASVLGIILGISGILTRFNGTGIGTIYTAVVKTVTMPLSTMILLVVGYSIETDRSLFVPCLKTAGLRAALQAGMIVLTLFAMHRLGITDPLMDTAVLIYMSAPPSFSLQSFVKDPEGANYAATVNALYFFITMAVFAVVSQIM